MFTAFQQRPSGTGGRIGGNNNSSASSSTSCTTARAASKSAGALHPKPQQQPNHRRSKRSRSTSSSSSSDGNRSSPPRSNARKASASSSSSNTKSPAAPRPRFKPYHQTSASTTAGGHAMPSFSFDQLSSSSGPNYATALLHVALTGASGWAMHETSADKSPIALGCFSFLFGHSLLGILRHTHPNVPSPVATIYSHCQLLAQVCPIALITAQVSRHFGEPLYNAYLLCAVGLVPTICELVLPEQNERALDLVVLGTCTSLAYTGVTRTRYWSMGLAVLTVLNHFGYRPVAETFEVPRNDLLVLGLGFFTVFAVNCLLEGASG